MKIAIIGSGNVGSSLGRGWHKAGHTVIFGARDPDSAKMKNQYASDDRYIISTIPFAITDSDVIVVATPPEAIHELIPLLNKVRDQVIIDTTNAVRFKPEGFPTVYHALKTLTTDAKIVKCFNSTGYENMADPIYHLTEAVRLDMFMAGDEPLAKQVCAELAKELGFENCYDFGAGDKVELLEQFALCWINLAIMQRQGRSIGFKLIRR